MHNALKPIKMVDSNICLLISCAVENPKPKEIQQIPRCIVGDKQDTCYSLTYVTTSDEGREIIQSMLADAGIPPEEVREFETTDEMDIFLDSNRNVSNAGLFLNVSTSADGFKSFRYTLQINETSTLNTIASLAEILLQ